MVPLVIIRPEPGCAVTLAAAQAMKLDARGYPLFIVTPRRWDAPPPGQFDAIIGGSANAFRHGGSQLGRLRGLPVYAVGQTTAQAAREQGFTVVGTGSGGMQPLLSELAPAHKRLLRLAGEERVPLTLPPGVTMDERVVYASTPEPMPPAMVALLQAPAIIALHSAEAARHLAAQCGNHGVRRSWLRLIALGSRIAQAAGDGWGEIAVATLPNDKALLALARQMCQDPGPIRRF